MSCEHACKYILKVKKITNNVLDISPGFSEIGNLEGNELRKYILSSREFSSESVVLKRYTARLQLFSGEADL